MISEQLFKKIKNFIMKKNKYLYMASLAIASLAMGACSSDDAVTGENGEQNARKIELTATYPTDDNATANAKGTRVTYTPDGKNFICKWESTDKMKYYGSSFTSTPTDFSIVRMTDDKAVFAGTATETSGMVMYPAKDYELAGSKLVIDIDHQKGTREGLKDVDYMWGKVNVSKGESQAPKYYTKLQKLTNTVHFVAQLNAEDKDQKIMKILVSGENFKTKATVDNFGSVGSDDSYIGYLTIEPENMTVGADGKTPDIYFKTFQTEIYIAQTMTIQILLENGKTYKKTYGRTKKSSSNAVKFNTGSDELYGHMMHFNNITPERNINTYLFSDGVSATIDEYYGNNNAGAKDPSHPGWPIAWVVPQADAEDFAGNAVDENGNPLKHIAIALTELEQGTNYVNAWGPSTTRYDNHPLETNASDPKQDYNGYDYTYSPLGYVGEGGNIVNANIIKAESKNYPLFYLTATYFHEQNSPCDDGTNTRKMVVPAGCSKWFVPSWAQWAKCLQNNFKEGFLGADHRPSVTDRYESNFEDATMYATAELALCYKLTNADLNLTDRKVGYNLTAGKIYAVSTDGNDTKAVPFYLAFGRYGRPTSFNLADDGTAVSGFDETNYHKTRPMFTVRPFIAF